MYLLTSAVALPALADPAVKAFGLQVETSLSRVKARVLNPPLLAYGSPEALTPGTRVSHDRPEMQQIPGSAELLCERWQVAAGGPAPQQ